MEPTVNRIIDGLVKLGGVLSEKAPAIYAAAHYKVVVVATLTMVLPAVVILVGVILTVVVLNMEDGDDKDKLGRAGVGIAIVGLVLLVILFPVGFVQYNAADWYTIEAIARLVR